ncbi:MAG TPA: carbohydrate kinase family protein [Anaerolineae bacterium]|nr:carbohydrate kinase family protein [Anaerolineae bacterium]HOG46757.1 carbohydrate kinase family protein [Anaerolineae bacterium]HOQ98449.1 carbohydrate kinase family protein [Anaerolineae bacterium]HPL26732.1 carbohydrate kinase family protein [Anaerolineae bacterium]
MAKPLDLLVLGEANVDLLARAEDPTPVYGQEKLLQDLLLAIGGSASIFACQAARLGLRTALAGVVGDDEFGRFVLRALAERGVDTARVRTLDGRKTGATLSLTAAHDRALLTYAGTIAALESAMIDPLWLEQARHVHVASYFLQPALAAGLPELLAHARRAGATVSLDTGWDPANRWDGGLAATLAEVDVFLPNESEALGITGLSTVEAALAELAGRIPTVAIKLGAAGAVARRGDEAARLPAMRVQVVDTTGAGDSFGAGFVYGCLQGLPLAGCLELGILCGGLSTRAMGGTASQPTLDEIVANRP